MYANRFVDMHAHVCLRAFLRACACVPARVFTHMRVNICTTTLNVVRYICTCDG